jgi:ubiquinone/menaquinone biosynthesis C-methylase UbiE
MDNIDKEVVRYWDEKYKNFDSQKKVEGNLYLAGENLDLYNKNILIIACGTGEHVLRAARAGARVCAVDISSQAIENAQMMITANELNAQFLVADACNTDLPDQYFDLIWGGAVLHHLDPKLAAIEMNRLIKPSGMVIFVSEPTFYNPILKWAYETAFGIGRVGRRRKFLFFKRRGDNYEKPIDKQEIETFRKFFSVREVPLGFMFFQKIGHVISKSDLVHKAFKTIDNLIIGLFPILKKYSYEYDFVFSPKKQ